jgi:carboxylesterase
MKQTTTQARLSQPAPDYIAALAQLAALQVLDGPDVNPVCRTQLLTHGHATDRVIVLIHGMTNCPRQFRQLAPLFFEQGYNVLLPRMPRNGLSDRNTRDLAHLSVAELEEFGQQAVDVARGLGKHVTVAGISAGATIAAWLAQYRSDVDAAVPIAPLFGILPNLPIYNTAANVAVMRLFAWAPNIMTQSVSPFKEGPPQGYLGFATRGLASVMLLGRQVSRAAATTPPRARSILMMLNPIDPAVNGVLSLETLDRWRSQGAQASLYTFDPARKLIHDIIDPEQRAQQCDYIYPILLEQITRL